MRLITILTSLLGFSAVAQTTLVQEDFSNGIPSNFILINDNKIPHASVSEYTDAWITLEDYDAEHGNVASSTSYFNPAHQANRWMIIPSLELGPFGNVISWEMKGQDISFLESMKILISTTGTEVEDFTDTLLVNSLIDTAWSYNMFNLSQLGYDNQTIHIAFVNQTIDGYKLHLDNIVVLKESDLAVSAAQLGNFKVQNPFNESLNVITTDKILGLELIDLNGKTVRTGNESTLITSDLNAGVYLLHVNTEKGYFKTRVVKY